MTQTSDFTSKVCAVARTVGVVHKGSTNTHFRYNYASAEDVLRKVNEALAANGLYVAYSHSDMVHFDGTTAVVKKTIGITDGETTIVASAHGQGQDKGDKAFPKAETAAAKYTLATLFTIAWSDDDPEADPETDRPAPRKGLDKFDKPKAKPASGRAWVDEFGLAGQEGERFEGLIPMLDAWERIPPEAKTASKGEHAGTELIHCPAGFVMNALDKAKGKARSVVELAGMIQLAKENQ